ncbi:MAG TPA: diacylglycerol kinase family protein [Gemmatimonadaceae bacterium]|jgi:diacylglycerol kinase family enzyme|nr:diacylglycerol kinase family protein [Gemmatimonadaceae bacterium]
MSTRPHPHPYPPAREQLLPAFYNPAAGSAARMRAAMEQSGALELRELPPHGADAVRSAIDAGAKRIVVAGGDGTIAAAASVLAGTDVELAIVPAGTLNHFARDLGIPTDPHEAVALALNGSATPVDLGSVNGRIFLNTSSVGAYVVFVRTRDKLERVLGYRLASLAAAMRTLAHLRTFPLELEVAGVRRTYRSPLVFVGVDERELRIPMLGGRIAGGKRGLHVLIPRAESRIGVMLLAFRSLLRGVRAAAATRFLDSFLVGETRVALRRVHGNVALDGELAAMAAPLDYRLEPGALRVVVPPSPPAAAPGDGE